MAYREDKDLEFLQFCNNEDLEVLVHNLIYNQDGELRMTEKLTRKPMHRKYQSDYRKYWKNIAEELQHYGANSLVSFFRSDKGVCYRELLSDVCARLGVWVHQDKRIDPIEVIEAKLCFKLLKNSLDKMTPHQFEELLDRLNLDTANLTKENLISTLRKSGLLLGSSLVLAFGGLLAGALTTKVIGGGALSAIYLDLAGIGAKTFTLLLGPLGLLAASSYIVAGPAYRVTIPAVIQISYMRAKLLQQKLEYKPSSADVSIETPTEALA